MLLATRALTIFLLLVSSTAFTQSVPSFKEDFSNDKNNYDKTGRGLCEIKNGVLTTKDVYASFGEPNGHDYAITFKAKAVSGEEQVQIWAGFRAHNRDDRYILGFRGGGQDNIYLSRMGFMGADEFLALRPLDFHPEVDKWYAFRIEVCFNRIRVFINDEKLPRIDVIDRNSTLAPFGKVTLGGGWIKTEYDDLAITPLPADYLKNTPKEEYAVVVTPKEKEQKRKAERKTYHPVVVDKLTDTRTTVSLNGQWLFMPVYEMGEEGQAVSPKANDNDWHSMNVPSFWNPIRIWLHGETFGPHAKGVSDAYFRKETERCEAYTFDYKQTSAAWYRQWIELPAGIEQKNTELHFDAVSKIAEVWINGTQAGKHTGMFGDFTVNGTGLFKPGKNLVVVKVVRDFVKDIKDAGKVVDVAVSVEVTNKMLKDLAHGFYGGDPAGIWQPVSLVITEPVKISDVFIKPTLTGASFEVTVKNHTQQDKQLVITTHIADKQGKVLYTGDDLKAVTLKAGEQKRLTYAVKGLQPKLWTPQAPNLYDFTFSVAANGKTADQTTITSGFRTFESKDGYLLLNGKRYWLRGGNHTPFALAPNNVQLAEKFYDLMKAGHMEVTRTHTSPYNELWMDAADRKGIGVSFEGTWPWLMINASMPDSQLIRLWADEFLDLLKKYRNHPSLLFWTINNEMKFYDNEPDLEKAKMKMQIVSDVVKRMRGIDPTRPICFDSNYKRKGKEKKFGADFFKNIDDGDIDDIHAYINWYDHTLFKQFNGEFQEENHTEGRPLISQEMSTGYPNNETGHGTRFYALVHQTPQTLVGNYAYEYSDPALFLQSQAFITGELAEALRRSNDKASGILHFALLTWFRNAYDEKKIEPYLAYYAMQRAMQPVLVSAEIWGRHFYAGTPMPVRVCVVNDLEDGSSLPASTLTWKLVSADNKVLASGTQAVPVVAHYTRQWVEPVINIPASLPVAKTAAKLVLTLTGNGKTIAANEYDVLLAAKNWNAIAANKKIVYLGNSQTGSVLDFLSVPHTTATSVKEALSTKADVYVLAGTTDGKDLTNEEAQQMKAIISNGGSVLVLNAAMAKAIYPEYIQGTITPTEGDIVNMDIPESHVFDGIEPLELRYFNNNKREVPTVCNAALQITRDPQVAILAKHIKVHGYINGDMASRSKAMEKIEGATIVQINDKGKAIVSTMSLEKGVTDPVAGKLLVNMLNNLSQ